MSALPTSLAILDIGSTEIVVIMLVALLLFGSKRMPDLARSLGKSLREFRKATSGLEAELKRAMEAPPSPPPKPTADPRSPGDKPPPEEPPEPFHYP
jgi:sec-independent protein translocase protein TatA